MGKYKISTTGSSNAQIDLWAGNTTNITLNNSTGVTMSNTASITYTDATVQTTAYTTAKDTKLNNIGSVTIATLSATTTLTTNTFFNCGSLTLSAGTYILTLNCGFIVVTGATTIGQMLLSHSTSPTALTTNSNLNINNLLSVSVAVNTQLVMPNTAIVSPTTTTTYYMLCQVSFGTASRLQFVNGTSSFQAVRIA